MIALKVYRRIYAYLQIFYVDGIDLFLISFINNIGIIGMKEFDSKYPIKNLSIFYSHFYNNFWENYTTKKDAPRYVLLIIVCFSAGTVETKLVWLLSEGRRKFSQGRLII